MKKNLINSLLLFLLISFSLTKGMQLNIVAYPNKIQLNTINDFKDYFQIDLHKKIERKLKKQRTHTSGVKFNDIIKDERTIEINDDLMAHLTQVCLFKNTDISSQKTWVNRLLRTGTDIKKTIQTLKKEKPETYNTLKKHVLVQGLKHQGNVHNKIDKYQTDTRIRRTSTTTTEEKEAIAKKIQVDINDLGYSPGVLVQQFVEVLQGKKDARITWDAVAGGTVTIIGLIATVLAIYFAFNSCEECEECPNLTPNYTYHINY